MQNLYAGNNEPSIDELLNDEIAHLLRSRDKLDLADVFRAIQHARNALREADASELA